MRRESLSMVNFAAKYIPSDEGLSGWSACTSTVPLLN